MSRTLRLLLMLIVSMGILALGGGLAAQLAPPFYRVSAEFGHGGCAGNAEFDISGGNTVQAGSGVLGCASGFGEVASTAGPGFLVSSVDITHTGFGTGTDMQTQSELTVPFMLVSDADTTASVALNLLLTGHLVNNDLNPNHNFWAIVVTASLDGAPFAMGRQAANGASGFPLPFPDGLTRAFSTNGVLVTTNTPHTLRLALTISASSAVFDGHVSLNDTTLTLATGGPVFVLPDGVTLADNPGLSVVNNRWIDPRLPPGPPDTVIDATTPRATLDGYTDVPGSLVVDNAAGLTMLDLPNLTSVGCDLRLTRNPDLMSFSAPLLNSVGCNFTVADNPALEDVEVVISGGIGGDITVTDNSAATNVEVVIGGGIGGDITVTDNSGATNVDLNLTGGVDGDVTVTNNGDAEVNVDTPRVEGAVTISTGGSSVSATTGDGTTAVTLANAPATMTALLPTGSFTSGVRFSIQSLGAQPESEGLDSALDPVAVTPLTAYQFSFAIPTLNADATLTFDIAVAALGEGAAAFLEAVAANAAALAVKGDAPDSVYQTFAICVGGQLPSAGGCVAVERLDAAGQPLAAGDPAAPATVRFTGVTGHFSTFAVVLVSPIDRTPPVFSGVPADVVAEATSVGGAAVDYAMPTAIDDRDGPVNVSCAPGSLFPMGATTVRCTATDRAGNTADATFLVTVVDTTPPQMFAPPAIAVTAVGALTPIAIGRATATDIFSVTVTHNAPASFPIGATLVTWTAVDANGNQATATQTVEAIYGFTGFTGPIAPGGTYRINRTLPLMFTLSFAGGTAATTATAALSAAAIGPDSTLGDPLDVDANGLPDGGTLFRFVGDHYQFNLSTQGWSRGAYRFTVTLDDGRSYSMDVSLK